MPNRPRHRKADPKHSPVRVARFLSVDPSHSSPFRVDQRRSPAGSRPKPVRTGRSGRGRPAPCQASRPGPATRGHVSASTGDVAIFVAFGPLLTRCCLILMAPEARPPRDTSIRASPPPSPSLPSLTDLETWPCHVPALSGVPSLLATSHLPSASPPLCITSLCIRSPLYHVPLRHVPLCHIPLCYIPAPAPSVSTFPSHFIRVLRPGARPGGPGDRPRWRGGG